MGFAPPEDGPTTSQQAGIEADASFQPSPTGSLLCGFLPIPELSLTFGLKLPFALPPLPPRLAYFLQLNCDLSNPISANFAFGGGRVSLQDKDADPEYGEGLSEF